MDNQISVDWDCIMSVFNRVPIFPITLIDAEILDYWCTHPTMWEVACNMQHSRHILAMVRYTLASGLKGKPAVIYGHHLFIYIPDPSGADQLDQCPVLLEALQGGLCHPSIYAHKANVLSSTPEGEVFHHAAHQWRPGCRSQSIELIRHRYPPRG